MPADDTSSSSYNLGGSAKKSAGSLTQASGAIRSPKEAGRKAKRPRKPWTMDLRKASKKARLKATNASKKPTPRLPDTEASLIQNKPPNMLKNVKENSGNAKKQAIVTKTPPIKPVAPSPKQVPSPSKQKQVVLQQVNNQHDVGKRTELTMVAKSPEKQRKNSIMNLTRLARDGRKPPDHYRQVARRAASPSNIDLKSLTQVYDTPNQEFTTIDDVYAYRGYKKLAKLDEGAFGIVYKACRVGDNYAVALKEVDLSRRRSKRVEEMKRELFVLQKVDSPCIVKLVEHFIVANTLVIVMELCAGSNLTHYLKESTIQEDEALHLFKQMALGIKIMHRAGIAHRDVKLNNFLLDSSRKNVKVADFGLSVVSYKQDKGILMAKTYCGTEPYMAPEILRRNSRGFRHYNPMYADIWALGVCLYAMLTRTFPFKMNLSQKSLFATQTARRWRIPRNLRDTISEDLKDLMWHMLDPEPDRRITMTGVITHPWLNPDKIFSPETNKRVTKKRDDANKRRYMNHDESDEEDHQDPPGEQQADKERSKAQTEAIASVMTRSQWKIRTDAQNLRVDFRKVCSICLNETDTLTGPNQLIQPCLCSGYRSYQHKRCVEEWIEQTGVVDCPFCNVRYEFIRERKKFFSYLSDNDEPYQDFRINLAVFLFSLYLLIVGSAICYNFIFSIYECDPKALGESIQIQETSQLSKYINNWQDLERLVDCHRSKYQLEQANKWSSIILFGFTFIGTIVLFIGVIIICLNTVSKQYIKYLIWSQTNFKVSITPYPSRWPASAMSKLHLSENCGTQADASGNEACT